MTDITITIPLEQLGVSDDPDSYDNTFASIREVIIAECARQLIAQWRSTIDRSQPAIATAIQRVAHEEFDREVKTRMDAAIEIAGRNAWGFSEDQQFEEWITGELRLHMKNRLDIAKQNIDSKIRYIETQADS